MTAGTTTITHLSQLRHPTDEARAKSGNVGATGRYWCPRCEVEWAGEERCWMCGEPGSMGRSICWAGTSGRPGEHHCGRALCQVGNGA